MQRVVKDQRKIFIQVDAYTNTQEREMFEQWLLTAKTISIVMIDNMLLVTRRLFGRLLVLTNNYSFNTLLIPK